MLTITLPQWLQPLFSDPGVLIWAAFCFIPSLLIIAIIMRITRDKQLLLPLIYALLTSWPIGFVTVMGGFFSGIAPAKLGVIWLIIFCGMLIFNIIFRRSINKFVDSCAEPEKAKA